MSLCPICQQPLETLPLTDIETVQCSKCNQTFGQMSKCSNGHSVCDECRMQDCIAAVKAYCLECNLRNPVEIMMGIFGNPLVQMYGSEHHFIVGAALVTAYANCGGDIDLVDALDKIIGQGQTIPFAVCYNWGTCGAGISTGIFLSLILATHPELGNHTRDLANLATSRSLSLIGQQGNVACCKRDSFISLLEAAAMAEKITGINIPVTGGIVCPYNTVNPNCTKLGCQFYPA